MKVEQIMQHLVGSTYKEVVDNLNIEEDQGDCCGSAGYSVSDALSQIKDKDQAILKEVIMISYDYSDFDRVVVNFIFDLGDQKGLILGYDMEASSGSGWSYGAFCVLNYKEEEVAGACW